MRLISSQQKWLQDEPPCRHSYEMMRLSDYDNRSDPHIGILFGNLPCTINVYIVYKNDVTWLISIRCSELALIRF